MFKLGADEGCYGIASGEEDESEVEYDSAHISLSIWA